MRPAYRRCKFPRRHQLYRLLCWSTPYDALRSGHLLFLPLSQVASRDTLIAFSSPSRLRWLFRPWRMRVNNIQLLFTPFRCVSSFVAEYSPDFFFQHGNTRWARPRAPCRINILMPLLHFIDGFSAFSTARARDDVDAVSAISTIASLQLPTPTRQQHTATCSLKFRARHVNMDAPLPASIDDCIYAHILALIIK